MYFIQYTHQQLCRYVVNTTQIYTVHSSAALQLDCVFSLFVNPLHFTGRTQVLVAGLACR